MNAPFEIRVWHELSSYRRVYQLRQGTRNVEAYLTDEDLEAEPYRTQHEWNEYIANKLCTLWHNAFDEKVQAIPPSHEGTAWGFRYVDDVIEGEVVDHGPTNQMYGDMKRLERAILNDTIMHVQRYGGGTNYVDGEAEVMEEGLKEIEGAKRPNGK